MVAPDRSLHDFRTLWSADPYAQGRTQSRLATWALCFRGECQPAQRRKYKDRGLMTRSRASTSFGDAREFLERDCRTGPLRCGRQSQRPRPLGQAWTMASVPDRWQQRPGRGSGGATEFQVSAGTISPLEELPKPGPSSFHGSGCSLPVAGPTMLRRACRASARSLSDSHTRRSLAGVTGKTAILRVTAVSLRD